MTKDTSDPRIQRGMEAMLRLRQARLDAGEKQIGWKVGFGTRASLEKFGLEGPVVGFLMDSSQLESGATVSVAGWAKGAAEPEVAVYLGSDLPGGGSLADAKAAIAAIGPAIELADISFPPDDPEAILKDNIYNRHVLLGRADATRAGCDLSGVIGHVFENGAETRTVPDVEALPGDIVGITRHVADVLAASGETLRAGQVIIMGAIAPHVWLEQDVRIRYQLDPIDALEVQIKTT